MFTGIIETQVGVIGHQTKGGVSELLVERPQAWDMTIGQSVAINGVCLTVVGTDETTIAFELVAETQQRTTFGSDSPSVVNLERAMLPTDRFEGHIVQGHVDTVGEVVTVSTAHGHHLTVTFDPSFSRLVVAKGSVTIDGVSLTITQATKNTLSVALIPHTVKTTTLGEFTEGAHVNLEFDIIGKYLLHNQNI